MLENKVAIITGGSSGIGFATARVFLENKARVIIFGITTDDVNRAVLELKNENSSYDIKGFAPKLSNSTEIQELFKKINDEYGKIDILINNAGIASSTPITEYTDEEYEKIADLNIKGVFVCSKEAVPYLTKTKGTIINTSSMVSIYGQPAGAMYPTSKFAVNGLTKSLARELAPLGIRVNAIAPGIINTAMVSSLPKEVIEPLIKSIPLGRIGEPVDIANAFLFLASDKASYISGNILSVDGCARS